MKFRAGGTHTIKGDYRQVAVYLANYARELGRVDMPGAIANIEMALHTANRDGALNECECSLCQHRCPHCTCDWLDHRGPRLADKIPACSDASCTCPYRRDEFAVESP